jgi:hypothetical protein
VPNISYVLSGNQLIGLDEIEIEIGALPPAVLQALWNAGATELFASTA